MIYHVKFIKESNELSYVFVLLVSFDIISYCLIKSRIFNFDLKNERMMIKLNLEEDVFFF